MRRFPARPVSVTSACALRSAALHLRGHPSPLARPSPTWWDAPRVPVLDRPCHNEHAEQEDRHGHGRHHRCKHRQCVEDLGLPDANDRLAKAELARQIGSIIRECELVQQAAAHILGIDQPKVSASLAGQLGGFSLERLARFLTLLGRDVQIVVRETSPSGPNRPPERDLLLTDSQ